MTQGSVIVDMFAGAVEHVELARRADVVVVAPATATTIARLAHGLAEDMVSLTVLATKAPVLVCPAMDTQMFENRRHPGQPGDPARAGHDHRRAGEGRLASAAWASGACPDSETILGAIRYVLGREGDLAGRKVVVTAGGTREPIDPVRYVGNYSSGKMGYAVAEAARDRGAEVVLVSAPTALPTPYGVRLVPVERAAEMRDAVVGECRDAQVLVMAAAVADYQPSGHRRAEDQAPCPDPEPGAGRARPTSWPRRARASSRWASPPRARTCVANARRKLEARGST